MASSVPKGGVVIGPFDGTELYANAVSGSTESTVSLWSLGLDSELVFVGDAGTT